MTLMQRIRSAGQDVDPGWDDRDVERVWQGLRRKRRRRAVAAGAGVAAVAAAGIAVWALLVVPGRGAVVRSPGQSSPPARQNQVTRFADGSTVAPWDGHEVSLSVVEDTPQRVTVALAKGAARFDVVPRAERVFSVRAGDVTVSVLGTAFSVERVADRVGVAVTRGAVRVDWGAGARRIAAGEEGWFPPLVVSPATGSESEREQAPAKETSPPARDGARAGMVGPRASTPNPNDARKAVEDLGARVAPGGDSTRSTRSTVPAGSTPSPALVEPAEPVVPPAAAPPERAPSVGHDATGAAKLLADADRARLAGHFDEGAALLERLIREYPGDERAAPAAFSLGRLLFGELGRPAEAARAFARARALAPDGPLAEDALAREVEAWVRAGEPARARAVEAQHRVRARSDGGPTP